MTPTPPFFSAAMLIESLGPRVYRSRSHTFALIVDRDLQGFRFLKLSLIQPLLFRLRLAVMTGPFDALAAE